MQKLFIWKYLKFYMIIFTHATSQAIRENKRVLSEIDQEPESRPWRSHLMLNSQVMENETLQNRILVPKPIKCHRHDKSKKEKTWSLSI